MWRGAIVLGLAALLGASPPAAGRQMSPGGLAALFAPPPHSDPRDTVGSPLDVRSVAFGQQDTHLLLDVQTQGSWTARELSGTGRSLCVVLDRGRLCVGSGGRGTVLRYQSVDAQGQVGVARLVDAAVSRPDRRSVVATFAPSALGLPLGPFTWSLDAQWRAGSACQAGCEDKVPDSGAFAGSVKVLAEPRCFGAAARDPRHPCRNPLLRHAVIPSPFDAQIWTNSPCTLTRDPPPSAVFHPCEFGVTGDQPAGTVALIGDSHAGHWRAALEVVAQAKRWRGISVTRPGCPFSTRVPASPALGPAACVRLHDETLAWLGAHPEIHTIFVSDWAEPASGPTGGAGGYGGGAADFGAMLDRVPGSVQHIYVLRDIPATRAGTASCVTRARDRHQPLTGVCAVPRSAAITPDPGAAAAASRGPRAQAIDLTRFFCGAARCYPLIGGAYVYKDDNHMNAVFSTSLGPFVFRALGGAG